MSGVNVILRDGRIFGRGHAVQVTFAFAGGENALNESLLCARSEEDRVEGRVVGCGVVNDSWMDGLTRILAAAKNKSHTPQPDPVFGPETIRARTLSPTYAWRSRR